MNEEVRDELKRKMCDSISQVMDIAAGSAQELREIISENVLMCAAAELGVVLCLAIGCEDHIVLVAGDQKACKVAAKSISKAIKGGK